MGIEGVCAFTAEPPAARDCEFCDEIRTAARSAPDNIAEGFYRFNPPDFANFVRIARGSLGEVRNQLMHAHARKYLNDEQFRDLSKLCRRAIGACRGLRLYLLSLPKDFDPRQPKADRSNRSGHDCKPEPRNQSAENQIAGNQNRANQNPRNPTNRNLRNPNLRNLGNPRNPGNSQG